MSKIVYSLLFCAFLLASCSKDNGTHAQGPAGNPGSNRSPHVTSAVIIPDKPTAATTLIVSYSGKDAEDDFIQYSFRWYVDNELVQDGSNASLEPGEYKKTSDIFVEVTPSDSYSAGKTLKTNAVTIQDQTPSISSVMLSPDDPPVGAVLSVAASGSDPDGDEVTYLYQWRVNERIVTEKQEQNQFDTRGLKKKDMVYAVVWASDGERTTDAAASNIVVLSNSGPQITSSPPTSLNTVYSYQVTAADPDKDNLYYTLETAPSGMTISPAGLIRWAVPQQVAEKQEVPIKIKVDDGDGGSAYQEYSLFLEMK